MKAKFNLTGDDILNKRFNIELKGYDAKEVDYFLDLVKKDYEGYELILKYHTETNQKLKEEKEELIRKNKVLNNHLQNLKSQIKELEIKGLSNMEIIKRLRILEENGRK